MIKTITKADDTLTQTATFRITESQHQDFLALLSSVPGSQAGNMYREVFSRGLKNLKAFSEEHDLLPWDEEAAADFMNKDEVDHDRTK